MRARFTVLSIVTACSFAEPPDVPGERYQLSLVSGDAQAGVIGSELAEPFVVRVVDDRSVPVTDFTVDFSVLTGTGRISTDHYRTDVLGNAQTTLIPGDGVNLVEARLSIGENDPISFSASGHVGMPARIALTSGNGQQGVAGSPLSAPFIVTVEDRNGNAVPGIPVEFLIASGEGLLSSTQNLSNASGQAEARLTLGLPGENAVEAQVIGLTAARFTAQSLIGAATGIRASSGDGQVGIAGTQLENTLVITVEDSNHNGVAGVGVEFQVTSGDGALTTTQVLTDASGQASTALTLGDLAGPNTVEARAVGVFGAVVQLVATGKAGPAVALSSISGGDQTGSNNTTLSSPLVVEATDAHGNPVDGLAIVFEAVAGGGSLSTTTATTDSSGRAQTILTLGSTGGTNTVEARITSTPAISTAFAAVNTFGMCSDNGAFRSIVRPLPGELVISEVLANPAGANTDALEEWFEISNIGTSTFDLNELRPTRTNITGNVILKPDCLPVIPGAYAVFAKTADPNSNGGLPAVDVVFNFSLLNASGDLQIFDGSTLLDSTSWTTTSDGASAQVTLANLNTVDNDVPSNFCTAVTPYGSQANRGSPREANFCP